jgi:signal transduction histidine kinase
MLRSAWIFLAAILLPSLVLAWLAVRSARDQQVVLEHQQAVISQDITDAMAGNVRGQIDGVRSEFVQITQDLLTKSASPRDLASDFDRTLRGQWQPAEVGFAVDLRGDIFSPSPAGGRAAQTFREENDRFLSNRENVEVYSSLKSQTLVARNVMNQAQNAAPVLLGGAASNFAGNADESENGLPTQASSDRRDSDMALAADSLKEKSKDMRAREATDKSASAVAGQTKGGFGAGTGSGATATTVYAQDLLQNKRLAVAGTGGNAVAAGGAVVSTGSAVAANSAPQSQSGSSIDANLSDDAGEDQVSHAAARTAAAAKAPAAAPGSGAKPLAASDEPDAAAAKTPEAARGSAGRAVATTDEPAPAMPTAPAEEAAAAPAATTAPAESAEMPVAATPPPALMPAPVTATVDSSGTGTFNVAQEQSQKIAQNFRNVMPQNSVSTLGPALSNSVPEESDFRRLIGADTSGALARFLDNKLQLMVWYHPSAQNDLVFGAQLDQSRLLERLRPVLQAAGSPSSDGGPVSRGSAPAYCLALLDDDGHPVARSIPDFAADWKHPFVATEIGEALPHWEAALYLTDPQEMSRSARTLQLALCLIVVLLVVAIVSGGSLIAADLRRQLRLAQQKTDFVSNVSHELKTPLTSIRMFADLLSEGRVTEPARQATYLKIISAESARLTRLINNVLDFARLERGAPGGERRPCDLVEIARDVVETCRPHLEATGQNLFCEIEAGVLPILGDRDALSQVVLNLVSNAEKYGGGEILVRVRHQETPSGALGCVDVLDRGPGVPPRQVESIFLPFHRLHDSLSSGIPGSGLGLTLARRMARAHGGDIAYSFRAGGGSCFTLAVPLTAPPL